MMFGPRDEPGAALLLDTLPEAMLLLDQAGVVRRGNRTAAALFGVEPAALVGQSLQTLTSNTPEHLQALLRQGRRSSRFTPGSLLLPPMPMASAEDGQAGPRRMRCELAAVNDAQGPGTGPSLLLRLVPQASATGRFTALSERIEALTREVSRRRVVEAALWQQTEWLQVVLRCIGDAVIATDTAARVVFMNPTAQALTGWTEGEARGQPLARVFEIINEGSRETVESPVDVALREGRTVGLANHTLLIARDRSEHPIDDSAAPIVDDDGRLRGAVLVFREISALVKSERERRSLEAQLRDAQKMQAVGTLAGGIAHDFNNVLGAILANNGLAREELPAEHPVQLRLEQVNRAGRRARDLVRQILAFSRKQPKELKRQPLRPLVEEAIALLRGTLPSVVQLDVQLSDEPLWVLADATQVEQVLMNLCTNAWHALGGSTGQVSVQLNRHEGPAPAHLAPGFRRWDSGRHACVRISDTGCGIDADTLQRIFDPFFTTKERGHGTGLGLSVAHGIVAEHRGGLAVRSSPGAGSRFELFLPLVEPFEEAQDESASAPTLPGRISISGPLDPMNAPPNREQHIAYVDDDEVLVITVKALLQRAGYPVTGFERAEDALQAIRAQPKQFSLVVTDYNMPRLSGLDLARELHEVCPGLPVIISSGYVSDDLRSQARSCGVAALLNKEDTYDGLLGLVGEVLSRH